MKRWNVAWLIPLALWGCSQNYSEEKVDKALAKKGLTPVAQVATKAPLPSGHPPLPAAEGRLSLGGISAEIPEGWQPVPPREKRRPVIVKPLVALAAASVWALAISMLISPAEKSAFAIFSHAAT